MGKFHLFSSPTWTWSHTTFFIHTPAVRCKPCAIALCWCSLLRARLVLHAINCISEKSKHKHTDKTNEGTARKEVDEVRVPWAPLLRNLWKQMDSWNMVKWPPELTALSQSDTIFVIHSMQLCLQRRVEIDGARGHCSKPYFCSLWPLARFQLEVYGAMTWRVTL